MSSTLIICDIDGVLADCSHRLHYLEEKDYGEFYGDKILDDELIQSGAKLLYHLWDRHFVGDSLTEVSNSLIFLTGRPNKTRTITQDWMRACLVAQVANYPLLMRGDGDYRPSPIVKVELLKACNIPFDEYKTIYFIDDDPDNVKAVCEAFPKITGITFGTKRMEENK